MRMEHLSVVSLCMVLPDKRIILSRLINPSKSKHPWSITAEAPILGLPLPAAKKMINTGFGICHDDRKSGRFIAEECVLADRIWVHPFVFHLKKLVTLKCPARNQYKAIPWDTLKDDLTTEALLSESGAGTGVFTQASVYATAKLHDGGHFGS